MLEAESVSVCSQVRIYVLDRKSESSLDPYLHDYSRRRIGETVNAPMYKILLGLFGLSYYTSFVDVVSSFVYFY